MLDKSKLPKNFNWEAYIALNPDLKKAGVQTEDQAKAHWLIFGYRENRLCSIEDYNIEKNILDTNLVVPNNEQHETDSEKIDTTILDKKLHNFDPKLYRWLNDDLQDLTDLQLVQHYIAYGEKEGRPFSINRYIPPNFDPRLYKLYNKDLAHMSNEEAIKHFLMHGSREGRIYFCGLGYDSIVSGKTIDNIPKNKGSVILINHDISKTGAPLFLYDLYDHIIGNNIFKNVYILEPYPNKILSDKPNKLYHYNDVNYLYNILTSMNPSLIYSNSMNFYLFNLDKFQYWYNKTILHFHEIYNYTSTVIKSIKNDISEIPTYVVSESIKDDFIKHSPFKSINVFPPFISSSKQKQIKKLYKEDPPDLFKIDKSKITIGMCGDLSDRKNILLFLRLARTYNEYNFVWVGGDSFTKAKKILDPKDEYPVTDNFYWVPNTTNPYLYFKYFDYFFLTSKEDPCPIVILENLFLNNKIIVIKNNIKTQHLTKVLENYIELKSESLDDIITEFGTHFLNKTPNYTQNNTNYITNFYSKPRLFQLEKNQVSNKHFILSSIYLDKNILDTSILDTYINIINQFIIRHQKLYNFVPGIVLSTNNSDIYGNEIYKYLQKSILNIQYGFILFKENYGYDIGGLVHGIKFIYDNFFGTINKGTYLAYLHNKSNISWENILQTIFYTNVLDPYDAIVPKRFFVDYMPENDINQEIFTNHSDILPIQKKQTFKYVQGTTFITRLEYLKHLATNFENIKENFTHLDKNDEYWQKIMSNNSTFQKYYIQYQSDELNSPIDWRSCDVVKKKGVKNYMELAMRYGLKGIPDAQFEHALERYIGYLICQNKPNIQQIDTYA